MQFAIDWLEGTILDRSVVDAVHELSQFFGGLTDAGYRMLGYDHVSVSSQGVKVLWNEQRSDMGVHVIISADSLAVWGREGVRGLILHLLSMGFRCSRIDAAFDDHEGLLDFEVLWKAVTRGELVTHFQKYGRLESGRLGEEQRGVTASFGRRGGQCYIRIYDKAYEQHLSGDWIRAELELRKERAAFAFSLLVQLAESDWAELAAEWLYGLLDFKVRGADSNKSRWETAGWWLAFLKACRKSRLSLPAEVKTIEQLRRWVAHQVGPSLYLLTLAYGESVIDRLIRESSGRLKQKHFSMLDEIKRSS